jgi:hypothetical protein
MTKQEAIELMKQGVKVTHPTFTSDEWMTMKDGKILTEDGYTHDPYEFWSYRTAPYFQTNWRIYNDN